MGFWLTKIATKKEGRQGRERVEGDEMQRAQIPKLVEFGKDGKHI
jgi:hypothetical protein